MYQNAITRNKICMETVNVEVVDIDRCFKKFVLNLLNNDIFSVNKNENITSTQIYSVCPTLDRRIERMSRCRDDLFPVYIDMDQFLCLVDISLQDGF